MKWNNSQKYNKLAKMIQQDIENLNICATSKESESGIRNVPMKKG